jgi:hypothetical protein
MVAPGMPVCNGGWNIRLVCIFVFLIGCFILVDSLSADGQFKQFNAEHTFPPAVYILSGEQVAADHSIMENFV